MKVENLMTKDVRSCNPETTVGQAAHLMWEADCGILPVVDDGELVGVVTDRDMYIALATRNALPSLLRVGAVARTPVVTCSPADSVYDTLARMKHARVRRLPVVDAAGTLVGMVSMNDIIRAAGADKRIGRDEVLETLEAICAHRDRGMNTAAA